ncbi:MAG TPA: hypothetical protein VGI22_04780 [Xanthobacteraceae bacterium]|jgi:hypothetical protein
MPGTDLHDHARIPSFIQSEQRTRYTLVRREDVWFILFGGEEFGPYKSAREARLFAIDAAYRLGEQGKSSEVMVSDEAGVIAPVWVYGRDAYPPRG